MRRAPNIDVWMEPILSEEKKKFCIKTFCWHGVRISSKFIIFSSVFLALFGGLVVWRMNSGPLDIGFAKEFIEGQLRDDDRGVSAKVKQVVLYWPDLKGPVLLGLRGGSILNSDGNEIVSIGEAALSFSLPRLLLGDLHLKTLIVKEPTLRAVRSADAGFSFGIGAAQMMGPVQEGEVGGQSDILNRIVAYIANPDDDLRGETSSLASLKSFQIQDAQVFVEDRIFQTTWSVPHFNIVFESTNAGLHAALYFSLPDENINDQGFVKAVADYAWVEKELSVGMSVQNFDLNMILGKLPKIAALGKQDVVLNGEINVVLDSEFNPKSANINLISDAGFVGVPELSDMPIPYKGLLLKASYDGDVQVLNVKDVRLNLQGIDTSASAVIAYKDDNISGKVNVAIKDLDQKDIGQLWPKSLGEDNSKLWIVDRVSGGKYTLATTEFDLVAVRDEAGEWGADVENLTADFTFRDMSVDYRSPLFPVTNASGTGHFNLDNETLSVSVETGKVSDIDVKTGQVELTNIIQTGAGVADIKLKLDGSLKSVLLYADNEPIELGKKVDFNLNDIKGSAILDVHVSLPTIKDVLMEQVTIDVSGIINEVFIPDVLQDLPLTGGPLNINVTNEAVRVKGEGKLSGRSVDLEWMEYLESKGKKYLAQTKAKILVDPELREHFGIILDDFVEGAVRVDAVYTEYPKGRSVAKVDVDMTQGRLFIDPFDFEKPSGVKGRAQLTAHLQGGELKKITNLSAKTPDFQLENTEISFVKDGSITKLHDGEISRFILGETDASLVFDIEKSGGANITMKGPFLDLQPFLNNDEDDKEGAGSIPIIASVSVAKMRTSKDGVVDQGKIYTDIRADGRFNQLELDAIAGTGSIYLRFKPDENGVKRFKFEADDAGASLKAFGVYPNMVGGKIEVYADPIGNPLDRKMKGFAQISNFTVVKAPALAHLFGMLSLPGLIGTLGGEGISFENLEANLLWQGRVGGGLITVEDGRTSGNSLGLTFDGELDQSKNMVDISGTIVPLSGVNDMIASIPLIGTLLTGGSGGVFAATYTMEGKTEDVEVSVNPLSVLAPGILRTILFE